MPRCFAGPSFTLIPTLLFPFLRSFSLLWCSTSLRISSCKICSFNNYIRSSRSSFPSLPVAQQYTSGWRVIPSASDEYSTFFFSFTAHGAESVTVFPISSFFSSSDWNGSDGTGGTSVAMNFAVIKKNSNANFGAVSHFFTLFSCGGENLPVSNDHRWVFCSAQVFNLT